MKSTAELQELRNQVEFLMNALKEKQTEVKRLRAEQNSSSEYINKLEKSYLKHTGFYAHTTTI